MTNKISNLAPYLMSSRKFPQDPKMLETELSKSYIETANCINQREVALYATNSPTITGQQWYSSDSNKKQQTLRQVFDFSDSALTITHNISSLVGITRIFGVFTDGTVWYPLPYVSVVAADQISVSVTVTQILIVKGGGAPPAITSGKIVLEWLGAA